MLPLATFHELGLKWAVASVLMLSGGIPLLGAPPQLASAPDAKGPGAEVRKRATRDAIKEEDLRKLANAAAKFDAQVAAKAKPVGESRPSGKTNILEHSIILSDGEKFTLIPEGAILHLPEKLQSHVLAKPQGDFTFWPNFLKRNASWLTIKEVPLEMAKGNAEAAQAIAKELTYENRAVVAVYKKSPIMIMEAQEPEVQEEKPGGSTPATTTTTTKSLNKR